MESVEVNVDWKYHYNHCKERAMERFQLALSLDVYFAMVNGKIEHEVIGSVQATDKTGRLKFRRYKNIPGVWLCRIKWPLTVVDDDMAKNMILHRNLAQLEHRELSSVESKTNHNKT